MRTGNDGGRLGGVGVGVGVGRRCGALHQIDGRRLGLASSASGRAAAVQRHEQDHDDQHGPERSGRPPTERGHPENSAGCDGDHPRRHAAAAQLTDPGVDRSVLGALFGQHRPGNEIRDHAGAAEERGRREQDAEQHRIDAEVLTDAAGDAGADTVGAAAAQPPLRVVWGRRGRVRCGVGRGHGVDPRRSPQAAHRGTTLSDP
jgi:hypothetical protein